VLEEATAAAARTRPGPALPDDDRSPLALAGDSDSAAGGRSAVIGAAPMHMEAVAQIGPQTGASISRGTTVVGEGTGGGSFGTTPTKREESAVLVPPLRMQPFLGCLRNRLHG
jgi:hypothetical protein